MCESLEVCKMDKGLVALLEKFRFRKQTTNAAIILKIDTVNHEVILEEEYDDISLDDLRDELPERQPRYVVYSYKYIHDDNRVSYPLCFIFSSPCGCKPELQMMYAGSKNLVVKEGKLAKVFEVRNTEEMTEEWLRGKLGCFR